MALGAVTQQPLRQALAAPVKGGDDEAARKQLADDLEIFLDEFGAALEHRHRAARMPSGRQ